MNNPQLTEFIHHHIFDQGNQAAEKSTRSVMWLTAVMMVVEVASGWWFNSMALLADGWHMSSHAVAIGLSAFAYAAARNYAKDTRFAFGTWKIEVLAGYTSAIFLIGVAVMMVVGSAQRLIRPETIHYQEAMFIGLLGLAVNLVCAWVLGHVHHHHDDHKHDSHEHTHHHDLNLKSAYIHVIADAATSVLAIVALAGGWIYGWTWLDPLMGIVGAVLVALWAKGLLKASSKVLLDCEMDHPLVEEIRQVFAHGHSASSTFITDLHIWRVGKNSYSCALSLVTRDTSITPRTVKNQLSIHDEIAHCTIEIHHI